MYMLCELCIYVYIYELCINVHNLCVWGERRTESPVCVSFYESEEDLRLFGAVVMGDYVLPCVLPNVCDGN